MSMHVRVLHLSRTDWINASRIHLLSTFYLYMFNLLINTNAQIRHNIMNKG